MGKHFTDSEVGRVAVVVSAKEPRFGGGLLKVSASLCNTETDCNWPCRKQGLKRSYRKRMVSAHFTDHQEPIN